MNIILYPTYFPSVSHFVAMVQANHIVFETEDTFQKQTNRNRMYIYSPNGKQLLNVPIKHSFEAHQKTKNIKIEYDFNWQKNHFKSLEAAYRTSPFFEYFEDELIPIFQKKTTFLLDLNLEIHEVMCKFLKTKLNYTRTIEYFKEVNYVDFRPLANGKKDKHFFEPYTQVFDDKQGFINNLSVLDLLFNEGRYAIDYLKRQELQPIFSDFKII